MRRPTQIECLYLDFDGFFASVEQTVHPELRGLPVGVVPFTGTDRTCVIAVSREAKLFGIGNAMPVHEARALCPDIVLVPQSPDLYRRAHNALLSEISAVLPIDAVKSIDELTCRVEPSHRADPLAAWAADQGAHRRWRRPLHHLFDRLRRQPAACEDGLQGGQASRTAATATATTSGIRTMMPAPLLSLSLDDIPGVGKRMKQRLASAGIATMAALLATQPKHMRALWGNVNGERLWYALHGYEVHAPPSSRGMYGHGRVLPPDAPGSRRRRAPRRGCCWSRQPGGCAATAGTPAGWRCGCRSTARSGRGTFGCRQSTTIKPFSPRWRRCGSWRASALPRSFRVVQVGVTLVGSHPGQRTPARHPAQR